MLPLLALLTFQLTTGIPHQHVQLAAGDLTHWGEAPLELRETAPGHYELQLPKPWLHELQYKFIVNGTWIADPSNPDRASDGQGGFNSRLALDFKEDPMLEPRPGMPAFEQTTLSAADRTLTLLSPPGPSRPSVTVYFQDGADTLARTGIANLLAALSEQEGMPALTGVFIPPLNREVEYENSDRYVEYLVHTVVPVVESRFPQTGGAASRRLIIGASLGGLISFYSALQHPEVFGNAAAESGSFWFQTDQMIQLLQKRAGPNPRLYADVGTFESADMTESGRKISAAARQNSYDVRYEEFPSTHDWIAWRNRYGLILRHFFARRSLK